MKQFEKQKSALIEWITHHIEIEDDGDVLLLDKLYTKIGELMPKAKKLKWHSFSSKDDSIYTMVGRLRYDIGNGNGDYTPYHNHDSQISRNLEPCINIEKAKKTAQEHYNNLVLEQIA